MATRHLHNELDNPPLFPATLTFAANFFGFGSALAGAGFCEERTRTGEMQPSIIPFSLREGSTTPSQPDKDTPLSLPYSPRTAAPIASSATHGGQEREMASAGGLGALGAGRAGPAWPTMAALPWAPTSSGASPSATVTCQDKQCASGGAGASGRRRGANGGRARDAARPPAPFPAAARPPPRPPPFPPPLSDCEPRRGGRRDPAEPSRHSHRRLPAPGAAAPSGGPPPGSLRSRLARGRRPLQSANGGGRRTGAGAAAASPRAPFPARSDRPPPATPARPCGGPAVPWRLPPVSPFSSAWRGCAAAAPGRDPRSCFGGSGSRPAAAHAECLTAKRCGCLQARRAAQGNHRPPSSQQRQRHRNRIQPDWRGGGGETLLALERPPAPPPRGAPLRGGAAASGPSARAPPPLHHRLLLLREMGGGLLIGQLLSRGRTCPRFPSHRHPRPSPRARESRPHAAPPAREAR